MKRYVWLFLDTGEFSASWSEEQHERFKRYLDNEKTQAYLNSRCAKLVKYECENDSGFKFTSLMRIN